MIGCDKVRWRDRPKYLRLLFGSEEHQQIKAKNVLTGVSGQSWHLPMNVA